MAEYMHPIPTAIVVGSLRRYAADCLHDAQHAHGARRDELCREALAATRRALELEAGT